MKILTLFCLIYLFICLFLAALGLHCCTRAFSSCGEWGLLFVAVCRLLIAVASLAAEHGLQARGLQQLWLVGSRKQAQQLWPTGLVAPWHMGSSQTRDRTHVPCIGRRILNHCATRKAPKILTLKKIQMISLINSTKHLKEKLNQPYINSKHRREGNTPKVVV